MSRKGKTMSTVVMLHKGQKFEQQGESSRFVKDVLRVGNWHHPATHEEIDIPRPRLEKLLEATNRYLKNGNKIPFPDGHRYETMANLGFWPGPFAIKDDKLFGVVEPLEGPVVGKIFSGSVDAVSVVIRGPVIDSDRNTYDEVITQICATNYPVVTKQGTFIRLGVSEVVDALSILVPGKFEGKLQTSLDTLAAKLVAADRSGLALAGKPGKTFEECVSIMQKQRGVDEARARALCGAMAKKAGELDSADIGKALLELARELKGGGGKS